MILRRFLTMSRITCSVVLLLSLYLAEAKSSRNVPAALWNIKGNSLHSHAVSAFEESTKKYMDHYLREILDKESTSMLVFLIDRLSLEDFTVEPISATSNNTLRHLVEYLEEHPHVFLPSVKDPVKRVHDVNCGVEEVYLDRIMDEKFFRSVSSALESSCVVILHLLGSEVMKDNNKSQVDFVKELFQPSLSTSKKNVVGMFSASKSSWESSKKEHGASRSLLSAVEISDDHLVNFSNCIMMYAENITVEFGSHANKTVDLKFPIDTTGSECSNGSISFVLKFPGSEEEAKDFELRMVFNQTISGWKLVQSTVKTADVAEMELFSEDVEAPETFSYSCGKFFLSTENATNLITITMVSFQIQPFDVGAAFTDSFDCVTYFTLPIWMGLFVSILFILILNTGIYALFSVKTMDRFDDPKGKTISVTPATD